MTDTFESRGTLQVGGKDYTIYRLSALEQKGHDVTRLPYALRILLENLLRNALEALTRADGNVSQAARALGIGRATLYRRMKLSKRLRDVRFGLGGYKYQTNIKYLLPRRRMIDGYKHFVDVFTDGEYQYNRLKAFFDLQAEGHHVPIEGQGFGNTGLFLKMVFKNWRALLQLTQRLARFSMKPSRVYYALKGFGGTVWCRMDGPGALVAPRCWRETAAVAGEPLAQPMAFAG